MLVSKVILQQKRYQVHLLKLVPQRSILQQWLLRL
uniref:Uncharacterized protein n=1 Tax=Siphoviridae sp. ctTrD1 TaxID=2825524 RepID=A0A8S5PP67_9CAUD|nr:MAG TPA: hypothetical protein [Siphoviridae sp. ctTrD1]